METTPDLFGDVLPTLDTERLRLRHPRPADAEAVLAIFGDIRAMRYWSHEPLEDLGAAQRYLAEIDTGFAERVLFQWAITEPDPDQLIGTVTLTAWDRTNRHAEVGFVLAPAQWGTGYASEAVRAVLGFGFGRMDLHRIEAELDPRNGGSERLLRRLGFRREGLLRQRWYLYNEWCDSLLYGLLRADWERSHAGPA
ncbi:MAG: GNAT family N-acetyltransferase [Bacteroidota bacterium]